MLRTRTLLTSVPAAAGVLWAMPLRAAEEGGQMPQLDATLFPAQLFWLAVTFGVLYLAMAYLALPSVKRTQDKRSSTIAREIAAAQAANDQAKAMLAQYEKALADARAKAQATVNEMAAQAAKESTARQAVQREQLTKRLADAEAKIAAARDAAVKEVRSSAAGLADVIMDKVMGIKPVHAAGER